MVNCSSAIDVSLNTHTHTHTHINPIHITKLTLLYDVELTKRICGNQKAKIFFFFLIKRINLKAKHELSCFIACHLGEIEASHKLMEPH